MLAWTRVFAFLLVLFTTHVYAREDTLFTSSVTYCEPPETLLIQRFQVAFFPRTQTVAFNLSAASVQANVNVTANLFLNVYGMKPLNFTLNLCSILDGELCPLPHYNFTGADSITLPNSFGVTEMIPKIAYQIPDLEGFAQFTLTEPSTGIVRACVQATLSNGWSAHQPAAEWSTGGVAIAALVASVLLTIGVAPGRAADAIAPFRFLDLMQLFQTIAGSALLSLNYPSIYRAYALNFAWAIGLFPSSESSPIQRSISAMRHRTGSQLPDSNGGSVVQFVNRRLSPYNNQLMSLFAANSALAKRDAAGDGEVQTVTSDSGNVLEAGLPIYVNSVHVSTVNAFMTVFLCWLMLVALTLAVLGLGYGFYLLWQRRQAKLGKASASPFDYVSYARSWVLRISLVSFGPLLIFIFYQWTLKDSWATILLSVLTFLAIGALIGFPIFLMVQRVRGEDPFALYTPGNPCLLANGPLYAQYRPVRYYFTGLNLAASFLRAIVIAFAKGNPRGQVGLLITVEALVVLSHGLLTPSKTRGGDVFSTYLAIVRLTCSGLLIAFLQPLNVNPIPRVVIGIVIAVIYSIAVIITVFNFALNVVLHLWSARKPDSKVSSETDLSSQGSMLEKGEANVVVAPAIPESKVDPSTLLAPPRMDSREEFTHGNLRPLNPTPDHSTPDRQLLPYTLSHFPNRLHSNHHGSSQQHLPIPP
ncbi:integral to membrane protein [Coprinopsis sp. MPI-PUGE-AT-0042]|nr:integral to membrane protein [Coprinopsis sp. MPI-PUGE-AT-0042]